ncbi:hypothetical protein OG616_21435 [Streptomyces antibioticus]|uniref:hypothetical protein n=1 Tax=Streptomyces antibioticus TaxID=1890 RepID=UPI00225007CF|nr:hypothetical protein [Streptomyces antibioticus]MCX5170558.1 hypothetical protein [Streptomyces antibioticus]
MTATPANRKVDALLWLAGGKSNREAAEAAGVTAGTVAAWKRQPTFAAELAAVKALYEERPQDGRAIVDRLQEAKERLSPLTPKVVAGGTFRVRVNIPAGASARQREQLAARAIARGLRAVREAES